MKILLYYYIISFTNSYVYKLSDFGTAKPLKDGDFFQSLVGTEEYLVNEFYINDRVLLNFLFKKFNCGHFHLKSISLYPL